MRIDKLFIALGVLVLVGCGGKTAGQGNGGGDVDRPPGDQDQQSGRLTARIVNPNGDLMILAGTDLTFAAEFFWGDQRVDPATVTWSVDALFLGNGNPLANQTLTAGVHQITVTGVYEGDTALDSLAVTVGDMAVRITNPDNGAVEDVGGNRQFVGIAEVVEGGNVIRLVSGAPGAGERQATFAWSSSLDGPFGTQDDFAYAGLSTGAHRITLTVSDTGAGGTGRSGSAAIDFTVAPPNTPPSVTITEPATCPVDLVQGTSLTLQGTVTDPDPADAGLLGVWRESITGHEGSGPSYLFGPGAALGKHAITLSATDNRGATRRAVCDIFIVPSGGDRTSLFPDTAPINDNLLGGNDNINWLGVGPAGQTFVGNDRGVTVYASDAPLGAYDGDALLGGPTDVQVQGMAFAGGAAFVATDAGLAQCEHAAGVLSNCASLSGGDFAAVAASGDPATTGLVAGAADGGLYLATFSAGVPTAASFDEGNSNLPTSTINDVAFVGTTLYVATDEGLCRVDDAAGAIAGTAELCTAFVTEGNSVLPDNEVRALFVQGGLLWLGTADGVVRYDPATGAMIVWDQASGMANDNVNDILIDASGIVWIATNGGVSRLDPTSGAITNFTGIDFGTPGDNRVNALFIDANGVKWFATQNGVVRYDGV